MGKFLIFCSCFILFSSPLHSSVKVKNSTGERITVSFHGDSCRIFDSDSYSYGACGKKEIDPGSSVIFNFPLKVWPSSEEREVIPSVRFSMLGFSYVCKVLDFQPNAACDFPLEAIPMPFCPTGDSAKVLIPGALMLVHSTGISLCHNYSIEIWPEYSLWTQPNLDCSFSECSDLRSESGGA